MKFTIRTLLILLLSCHIYAATISSNNPVDLYQSPNHTNKTIGQIKSGTYVTIIATNMHKGYILVETDDGLQGWVSADFIHKNAKEQTHTDKALAAHKAALSKIKQQGKTTLKHIANKTPGVIQDTRQYARQLKDEYGQHLKPKQERRWFLLGAIVLIAGILIGLFIGNLVWRRNRSYLR